MHSRLMIPTSDSFYSQKGVNAPDFGISFFVYFGFCGLSQKSEINELKIRGFRSRFCVLQSIGDSFRTMLRDVSKVRSR